MRRQLALLGLGALVTAGVVAPAAQAADLTPNLGMGQLSNLQVQKPGDGRRLLRFDTIIVNVGHGPFELRGSRSSSSENTMSVTQRVYSDTGTHRDITTAARMQFDVGDGHSHWHVMNLADYSLTRLDNGRQVATGLKQGFCFYDNLAFRTTLPGAPASATYRGCGTTSTMNLVTGLSVGWGDIYRATVANQYVPITGLPSGQYRLTVTTDPFNWFFESDEADNRTWVDLNLKGNGSFKVIRYGPSA